MEIIKKNISFVQQNIDRQSALKTFSEMGEKFKEEIILTANEEFHLKLWDVQDN